MKLESTDPHFLKPSHNGKPITYLCGHSLGLQPKDAAGYVQKELERWGALAVDGHFVGEDPWMTYHESLAAPMGYIVGAPAEEVSIQNTLSVNIHLMLASFYRPAGKRVKILMEAPAFPSDQYAVESHLTVRGFLPERDIVEVPYDPTDCHLGTERIVDLITQHSNELALVFLGGVQYISGEVLDMELITHTCRERGIAIGWDLAHAVGNVELDLHAWSPDFAVWCCYKYLNGGPGTLGGLFVPERHFGPDTPRLAGWWGYKKQTRFKMAKGFDPIAGADGWALSNPPILAMAPLKATLPMFEVVGMATLREKSRAMIQKARRGLEALEGWHIFTPDEPQSGNMLTLSRPNARPYFDALTQAHIVGDWREPGIIRVSFCPLYTTEDDVDNLLYSLQNQ
jgi:kynureninase